MKTFTTEYIKGCATCQITKVNTHPAHPPLFPIMPTENARPFETITLDFITKLLLSGGHDTILTITDTDCSKASIFIPCNEAINSKGVALLYVNHVLLHYGIPQKIISDHDICFILQFSTELCRLLNIHQNISTAYHPQTDRASKRTNQALEQYLCTFCSTQQNNWHIVFKGPVHWTGNLTETRLDLTEKDQISVLVKSSPWPVQLMVHGPQDFQKDRKKPV